MLFGGSGGRRHRFGAGLRSFSVIAALGALELVALGAAGRAWGVVRHPGPASLDEAVVLVVLVACALVGGWLVVSTTIADAAHLPGRWGDPARRWAPVWAPAVVRRIAAVLVGAALGGTLVPGTAVGDAAASERVPGFVVILPSAGSPPVSTPSASRSFPSKHLSAAPPVDSSAPGTTSAAVPAPVAAGPGWMPSRPVGTADRAVRLVTSGSVPRTSEVVVHRGDTLWDIARRHLGPGASDAEVAAAWPRWYATNQHVIGPDPDVLLPEQVLRAPEPSPPGGPGVGARR
jgi:hypothetical protein